MAYETAVWMVEKWVEKRVYHSVALMADQKVCMTGSLMAAQMVDNLVAWMVDMLADGRAVGRADYTAAWKVQLVAALMVDYTAVVMDIQMVAGKVAFEA